MTLQDLRDAAARNFTDLEADAENLRDRIAESDCVHEIALLEIELEETLDQIERDAIA